MVFFQGWEEPSRYNPEPCNKTRARGGRRQRSSSQVAESRDQTLDPGERFKRSLSQVTRVIDKTPVRGGRRQKSSSQVN